MRRRTRKQLRLRRHPDWLPKHYLLAVAHSKSLVIPGRFHLLPHYWFPPAPAVYVEGSDYDVLDQSESGDVTALVTPVDLDLGAGEDGLGNNSTSGCDTEDFAGFPAGHIALIERGTCSFQLKAENAFAAGAAGVIIFNQGNTEDRKGLINGTLSADYLLGAIPVFEATFDRGLEWATTPDLELHMIADVNREVVPTSNVIAETHGGRDDRVVVVGSQYYVDNLSAREIKNIAANLNFDMIGSPNYVRFVYDGDGSDTPDAGPNGSQTVEAVFLDYFAEQGLPVEPTAFDGRSDYGPFIDAGIPAGGLFTGAEEIKTEEQVAIYGGAAGDQLDPCYHLACDTIDNISFEALD